MATSLPPVRSRLALVLLCCLTALGAGCAGQPRQSTVDFAPPGRTYLVVQADTLNMRRCPDKTCQVVALLYRGETVAVRRSVGEWSEIERKLGGIGWVASRYLGDQHLGDRNRMGGSAPPPALPEEELAQPASAPPPEITDELAEPGARPGPGSSPPDISEEFGQ